MESGESGFGENTGAIALQQRASSRQIQPAQTVTEGVTARTGARTAESARFFTRLKLADMAVRAPIRCLDHNVHCQSPLGDLEVLRGGRRNDALGFRHPFLQSQGRFVLVGFVLAMNPFRVFVARTGFAKRTKRAFGRTLEEGFKERGCDFHGWSILRGLGFRTFAAGES